MRPPPTVGRYRGYDLGPSLSAGDRLPRRRAVALLQAWDRALRMAAICAGALRGRIGETQASIALAVRAMGTGMAKLDLTNYLPQNINHRALAHL